MAHHPEGLPDPPTTRPASSRSFRVTKWTVSSSVTCDIFVVIQIVVSIDRMYNPVDHAN